jgi:hypothetical protein
MEQKLHAVLSPLGLKKPEVLVYYKMLAYDHVNTSVLSRETKIPRTSLYTILATLEKRELARQITIAGHKEWQAASPEELQAIVNRSYQAIEQVLPELVQRQGYKSLHKKGTVEFIAGQKTKSRGALRTLYSNLRALPKHEHVYVIEGVGSKQYKYGSFGASYKKSWQNLLTDASFALQIVVPQSSLEEILTFEKSNLQLFLQNPISLTVFDDTELDFDCDIIISKEQVFFAHPQHNAAAIVNYKYTADAMVNLFKKAAAGGEQIPFQEVVRNKLRGG